MQPAETTQFVTITEATKLLHRDAKTVRLWIKRGKVRRKGKRYDLEQLRLYGASRKAGPQLSHLAKIEREASAVSDKPKDEAKEAREELSKLLAAIESPAGLSGAIERLRAMERTTYGLYVKAHQEGSPESEQIRARLHADVVQHLIKSEAIVDVRKEVRAEEQAELMAHMTAWAEPVRALVDQMPRSLALRVNVTDPGTAEAALRDWVHKELYPMLGRKVA